VSLLFAAPPKTYKLIGVAILMPKTGKPSEFRFSSGIDPNEDNGSIGFLGISNGTSLCGILDPFKGSGILRYLKNVLSTFLAKYILIAVIGRFRGSCDDCARLSLTGTLDS
jgi:hypothetical protein